MEDDVDEKQQTYCDKHNGSKTEVANPEKNDPPIKDKLMKDDLAEETLEEQCDQQVEREGRKAETIPDDNEAVIAEDVEKNAKELIEDPMDIDADCNIYGPFLYESFGELLVFRCVSDNFIMKCPLCGKETGSYSRQ